MDVSEIEAVCEFLRKNGLSRSESALKEDISEKSKVNSCDFERFMFPVFPPPRPLRIPSLKRKPTEEVVEAEEGIGSVGSSSVSSGDEFLSLVSSITDLCSSELKNTYGIYTGEGTSPRSSSDRLSQFGTAKDYYDYDMESDLCCFEENDHDHDMPPCFAISESFCGQTEDKFIMTHEKEKKEVIDHDNLDEKVKSCSSPFHVCGAESTKFYVEDRLDHGCLKSGENNGIDCEYGSRKVESTECEFALKHVSDNGCNYSPVRSSMCDFVGDFKNVLVNRVLQSNGNGNKGSADDEEVVGELNKPATAAYEEAAVSSAEFFNTEDDEYELFNLRIIHRRNRTGFEEHKDLPIVLNSIIAGRYYVQEHLGSAAFSEVVQAHDLQIGIDVCLKIIKNNKDFFDQSLDEIKLLKFVNRHDPGDERHILRLYDYFYFQEHLFIVSELLRSNLYEFQKYNRESGGEPYFTMRRLQVITRQCLEALDYLHELGIIHCDLKPENILMKSVRRCEIKIIDLGSSCFLTDNLYLYIQSRSYRAPEVILGLPYDQKIDLWSLGCILAELCSGEVLFPNEAVEFILARMIGMLGPIDIEFLMRGKETHKYFTEEYDLYHVNEETNEVEYIIPEECSLEDQLQVSDEYFINFVRELLEIDPHRRPTAREALEHPWLSLSYR